MISTPCIEVQTTSEKRFSVPAWFAEVVIMARYLEKKGLLEAFAQQVRLVRGRFGTIADRTQAAALAWQQGLMVQ